MAIIKRMLNIVSYQCTTFYTSSQFIDSIRQRH